MSDLILRPGDLGGSRFVIGCDQREVNDRDPRLVDVPRSPSREADEQRKEAGMEFEDRVFMVLCEMHRVSNLRDFDDSEATTRDAMERGDEVIIGPTLPVIQHRGGRPDILVRHGETQMPNGKWAYLPVDVKNSKPLEGTAKAVTWRTSSVSVPSLVNSKPLELGSGKPKREHSLQLAHYWLMLEELGHAPTDIAPIGGTLNPLPGFDESDLAIVWRDLDGGRESLIEFVEVEWRRRWEAINAVRDGGDPITRPFLRKECESCHWRDHCNAVLEAEQHVSLLQGVGEASVLKLASIGIHTIPQLASVNLSDDGRDDVLQEKLITRGVDTARVLLSGVKTPFMMRGQKPEPVPRADIEIDFDIENDDIVYMYGLYVSNGQSGSSSPIYRSFHSYDRSDLTVEGRLLAEFWQWLHDSVDDARSSGKSIAVYCYSGGFAEIPRMREAATRCAGMAGVPSPEEISELESQDWWVDMHKIVKNFHWPLRKLGLKDVAKLAGMEWDASDAGGANSMLWYRIACDESNPDSSAMAEKLLRYNTDDVRATWMLRNWLHDGLNGRGWSILPVESLG